MASKQVEMVIVSNMGRADGGRETWCYNFIPQWLRSDPDLSLRLHGLRSGEKPDNAPELMAVVGPELGARFSVNFFRNADSRLPPILAMIRSLRAFTARKDVAPPAYSVATGIAELLAIMASPKLRARPKIVWLRTIFLNEKAKRIPPALLPLARKLEKAMLRRADLLIANGHDIADHYGRQGHTVHVVQNGVDLDAWRLPPPSFGDKIRVAFIGRLTPVKGFNEFVGAARTLAERASSSPFEFHAVGEPWDKVAVDAALADQVIIHHGAIDNRELPRFLADVDVCVAFTFSGPSGGGGTSNALMEQMAAGRVIIAWDNIIFRQLLDERSAYMAQEGNVEAVVSALEAIASDRAEAKRKAEAARAAIEPFSLQAQFRKYQAILAQAALHAPAN